MSITTSRRKAGGLDAWDEQCRLMLRKAAEDEEAMSLLSASRKPLVGIIGFHAQQAVEKRLKGLLSFRRITFPKTHDIEQLLDRLEISGVSVPPAVQESAALTPYAVHMRYTELGPVSDDAEEVAHLLKTANDVRLWVQGMLPFNY